MNSVAPAPPPGKVPMRRNAVVRVYDAPLHRDWAFWMTLGWGLLSGPSIATSDEPRSLPIWLDSLLAAVFFMGLFGVFPTWIRLQVRRWLARRGARGRPTTTPRTATPLAQALVNPPMVSPIGIPVPAPPPLPTQRGTVGHGGWALSNSTETAKATLPYPVARAIRTLQSAPTPRERYEALLDAAEALAITVTVTVAALLRARTEGQAAAGLHWLPGAERSLSELRSAYLGKGAMFGTWTRWLENVAARVGDVPGMTPDLQRALRGENGSSAIFTPLNLLRQERNRAAHGNRPQSQEESALRVKELMPLLYDALETSQFLRKLPWLLTVSCSYVPRERTFDVVALYAMGDHPDFESRTYRWAEPVGDAMYYVLSPDGAVALSPFVARCFCPQCRQLEDCYAYRVDKPEGPAEMKSFGRGHDIAAPDLGSDIRSLPHVRRPRQGR